MGASIAAKLQVGPTWAQRAAVGPSRVYCIRMNSSPTLHACTLLPSGEGCLPDIGGAGWALMNEETKWNTQVTAGEHKCRAHVLGCLAGSASWLLMKWPRFSLRIYNNASNFRPKGLLSPLTFCPARMHQTTLS